MEKLYTNTLGHKVYFINHISAGILLKKAEKRQQGLICKKRNLAKKYCYHVLVQLKKIF